MSFSDVYRGIDYNEVKAGLYAKGEADVKAALTKDKLTHDDLLALLSPAAEPLIEDLARRASFITRKRFGNTMNLYAPLYLSNECTNSCTYCGFNKNNDIDRVTLSVDEALREADIIYDSKMRDILLVSGEAPKIVTMEYLKDIISHLTKNFASIAVEIYPMDEAGYRELENAGCDGLTVYQETYDEALYETLHKKGKKRNFYYRMDTPDRGGRAGMRRIGIGILMGLSDWRVDAAILAAHASYLVKKYWKSKISVSFPRLRPAEGGFTAIQSVTDLNLLQAITAFRVYLNDISIVLSTREASELRDNLIPLGITQMSAGSKTNPGGYLTNADSSEQFSVEDQRSPGAVSKKLSDMGYDPVFKDWEA
jgi:2-iminoacetate synthase